jgi:hypothetical protein
MGPGDPADPATWDGSTLQKDHELEAFLAEVSDTLKADYRRIRRTARSDPGTAGDQSETTWASLFRNWLPPTLAVRTKGRIVADDGRLSDQMDVVILRDTYPAFLAEKKIYLAGGVLAAFECKLTLRPRDIAEAVERGQFLRSMVRPRGRAANLRDALVPPIAFGLLAHSSERLAVEQIDGRLAKSLESVEHPREALDVLCVANLATWTAARTLFHPRTHANSWEMVRSRHGVPAQGGISVSYLRWKQGYGGRAHRTRSTG